jgi:hypothetical protein
MRLVPLTMPPPLDVAEVILLALEAEVILP